MEVRGISDIMEKGELMGRSRHNGISYVLIILLVVVSLTSSQLVMFAVSPAVSFAAKGSSDTNDPDTEDKDAGTTGKDGKDAAAGNLDASDAVAGMAAEVAQLTGKAAKKALNPPITRKEVYKLKVGRKISRKVIKKRGGASRYFQIYKIRKDDRVYKRINGKSYRKNPNIGLSDLRYIKTLYYDFDGKVRTGEIIVNKSIAKDTVAVFRELYKIKYQIHKMKLVDNYYPKKGAFTPTDADTASMNDDNTSGFNYRTVAGTSSISMHGYGRAIDINPFENPWCPGGTVYYNQKRSAAYANRTRVRPHMIFAGSDVTKIFRKYGFRWLGATGTRDYQHFEK